jgi:hypothetical protein
MEQPVMGFLTPEFLSLIGGSLVGFIFRHMAEKRQNDKEIFERIECVILAKIDDFIPHYIVKVMAAYFKMGFGSSDLYD